MKSKTLIFTGLATIENGIRGKDDRNRVRGYSGDRIGGEMLYKCKPFKR